jgi:hypothetical protein
MNWSGIVGVVLAVVPTAALADWQYTRWGMTPQQVIAASNGTVSWRAVKLPKPNGPREEIGGSYAAGERIFDVSFTFSDGRLSIVSLKADPCDGSLLADLKSRYGRPLSEAAGMFPFMEWDDKRNDNRVTLFEIFDSCLITYTPLAERSQGL